MTVPWLDALDAQGFVVLPSGLSADAVARLQTAYDEACAAADPADVHLGRSSTRVNDFVNRGPAFEWLYTWPPALDAAGQVVGGPFKLSALHARTLHAHVGAQQLHVDLPRDSDAWPMLGVILMVDAFRADNGATRFVPGSHRWAESPERVPAEPLAAHPNEILACGDAGSIILFDASTWHGYSANTSSAPRRSLQWTFIPKTGRPATDFLGRMKPDTRAHLSSVAREILGS